MKTITGKPLAIACATIVACLIAGVSSLIISAPVGATEQFSKDTGKSCADCHSNPKGGGALTAFGKEFKAHGNKMPN